MTFYSVEMCPFANVPIGQMWIFMPLSAISCWRHAVYGLSVCLWSYTKSLWTTCGTFTKFTNEMELQTKMNWLDSEVRRSASWWDQVWSNKALWEFWRLWVQRSRSHTSLRWRHTGLHRRRSGWNSGGQASKVSRCRVRLGYGEGYPLPAD